MGDEGTILLAQALAQNKSLHYLNVSLNDVGSNGCKALCAALCPNPLSTFTNTTLMHLDLSINRLGFEGLEHVQQMLMNQQSLVTLSLRSNRFGAKAKDAASKMLEILALKEQSSTLKDVFL